MALASIAVALECLLVAISAHAAIAATPDAAAAPITLIEAWSRPAIDTGVVYVRVANASPFADMIDSARTPVAHTVELHRSMNVNDMATMKPVYAMPVPARGSVAFTPGADHLMLIGLKSDLKTGQTFPIDLHLRHAGWVSTTVHVRAADPSPAASVAAIAAVTSPASAPTAAPSTSGYSPETPFPEMAKAHSNEGVSQSQIVLDAAVFVLGLLVLGGILVYIGKRIFTEKD